MNTGGFPVDLILFGMIAAFLALRLRSILGRRDGFEQPPPHAPGPLPRQMGPIIQGKADPVSPAARALPEPNSPAGLGLQRLHQADPRFDAARFIAGAEHAFRLVVEAFAAGNRVALRPLLTDETYRSFESAITAREGRGESQQVEIRRIPEVSIISATLRPQSDANDRRQLADIEVRFVSDQVNVTLDHSGRPVEGVDAVTEIVDLWTFERDLASNDPAWRLAAAHSA